MSDEKTSEYIERLREYKEELKNLKNEFSKFNPTTDWIKKSIEPLLETFVGPLEEILTKNLTKLTEEQINAQLEFLQKNIEGLKKVLESERKFSEIRKS